MITLMLGEEALALVLGEEGLTMVPTAVKTERSILQKISRKTKVDSRVVAKRQQKNVDVVAQ
jgi:hypothetical protein